MAKNFFSVGLEEFQDIHLNHGGKKKKVDLNMILRIGNLNQTLNEVFGGPQENIYQLYDYIDKNLFDNELTKTIK